MRSIAGVPLLTLIIAAVMFTSGGPSAALAEGPSVKAIFEKHALFGAFALDCNKPISKDNLYFLNWASDEGHVQRDQMSALNKHDFSTIIDHAVELTADEISVSGKRNGVSIETVYRLEGNRSRVFELTLGGKKLISGGKWTANGKEVPWIYKCGGTVASNSPTPNGAGAVKAIFEKHKLLGTFAADCTKPPKAVDNWYYVDRLVDPDHVQRDVMESKTSRTQRVIIDRAWEWQPNEVGVSGNRDGKPIAALWRLDGDRMVQWETIVAGVPEISGGKWLKTKADMPWLKRCGDVL
jgi:hypothetical protein